MFILSEILRNKESGFYIMNPDFDEVEKEMYEEEKELAEKLASYNIYYDPDLSQKSTYSKEEYVKYLKGLLNDPFVYENGLRAVLVKQDDEDEEKFVLVGFNRPGGSKLYWATLTREEFDGLSIDAQYNFLRFNARIALELFKDIDIINVEFFSFIKEKRKKVGIKISYEFVGKFFEAVFFILEDKELLSKIKVSYEIGNLVKEAWKEFRLKKEKKKEKEREVKMAIKKALRIFKKESSGWIQYTAKFSEKLIYIFKPRKNKRGVFYYSVFKIEKGIPNCGIPDKVEPLFAVSTDEFIKKWEDLLERRK